jgi:hypothetical protein
MADFGLCWLILYDNWSIFLMVITTDQSRIWARYNFHTLWFSLKNFRFLQFCSGFVVISRYLNRFLKLFRDIFSKFVYWFKDVQVVRVILPGKDNERIATNPC